MFELRSSLFVAFLVACGNAPLERPGPDDPCAAALSMHEQALSQLPDSMACDADEDCVVVKTAIACANVQLGDCGTLVNRGVQSSLDWARIEHEICQAVEGSDFGCSVSVSCAALGAPRCERGVCTQD